MSKNGPQRYIHLLHVIELLHPQTIIEVGTWNGDNAIRMINQALVHRPEVSYYGYDLFESATEQTDKDEFNVKPHHTMKEVSDKIRKNCGAVNLHLSLGNTNETLPEMRADLAFIDGGHSVATIANDHAKVGKSAVVVYDDYYTPDEEGRCPDITKMGCNQLISTLKHVLLLPTRDAVAGGGYTQFAMVIND